MNSIVNTFLVIARGEEIVFIGLIVVISLIVGLVKMFMLHNSNNKLLKSSQRLIHRLNSVEMLLNKSIQNELKTNKASADSVSEDAASMKKQTSQTKEKDPIAAVLAVLQSDETPEEVVQKTSEAKETIAPEITKPVAEQPKTPASVAESVKPSPSKELTLAEKLTATDEKKEKKLAPEDKSPEEKKPKPRERYPVKAPVDWESLIGQRWMTWVGVAVLFFSAVFFIKYAFDNEYVGPKGQIFTGAMAGIGILILGTRLIRKKMRALGQGLLGLGLAVLYVTFSAASSSLYVPVVLSSEIAFALLVGVTVSGMTLALLHNALPISVIALLGGLLTPVLVSTGQNSRDALFAYVLLLGLGVFGVSFFRRWRVLDNIAIVGSYILYSGWFHKYYSNDQIIPAMIWLGALYLLFLALSFAGHLARKIKLTPGRFILALANILLASGFMGYMLSEEYQSLLALLAIVNAAIFLWLGTMFRRHLPEDIPALFGFIALSVAFLTVAVPLYFGANGVTLAWALEGPVLLFLGYKFKYKHARTLAAAILGLAVIHLLATHMPLHKILYQPFINKTFLTVISLPIAIGVFAFIHNWFKKQADEVDSTIKLIASLGGGFLATVLIYRESCGWLELDYQKELALAVGALIWALSGVGYLFGAKKVLSKATWVVGCIVTAIGLIIMFVSIHESRLPDGWLFINTRFVGGAILFVATLGYGLLAGKKSLSSEKPNKDILTAFSVISVAGLLLLCSNEVFTYVQEILGWTRRAAQLSLSIMWGVYATTLLIIGFWKRIRPLRYAALALFGITAVKLFFVDMRMVVGVIRIVAFMSLGILLLLGSYLYHKLEKLLAPETKENEVTDNKKVDAKND